MLGGKFGLHIGSALALFFIDQLTNILDNFIVFLDIYCGINTAPMNRRTSHFTELTLAAIPHLFELAD